MKRNEKFKAFIKPMAVAFALTYVAAVYGGHAEYTYTDQHGVPTLDPSGNPQRIHVDTWSGVNCHVHKVSGGVVTHSDHRGVVVSAGASGPNAFGFTNDYYY